MLEAARSGAVAEALAALDRHRLLCAHRRGPYGVLRWGMEVERWLAEAIPGYAEDGEWYVGRPLLVTANDYEMSLYNGDTGVIVDTPAGIRAAFARGAAPVLYPPVRLDAIQTVHAMTVHRAQGSQFDTVSFVLPPPDSPLLTRELLYTAVTRAREQVNLIGSEEAIRRAMLRPANRASGLRHRLAEEPTSRRCEPDRAPHASVGRRRWCWRSEGADTPVHLRAGVRKATPKFAPPISRRRRRNTLFVGSDEDGGSRRTSQRAQRATDTARARAASKARPSRQASIMRNAMELRPGNPSSPASSFALSSSRVYHSAWAISRASMLIVGSRCPPEERDHQRTRERPWLAAEVMQVGEADVDLFADFAVDCLLERLAGLDKAGQHRHPIAPRRLAAEQQAIVGIDDCNYHGGIGTRKVVLAACRAMPGKSAINHYRRAAAPRALGLHPMPMREGRSRCCNVALIVGELEPNFAEIMHLAFGQRLHREDRRAIEQSEQSVPLAVVPQEGLRHP